MVHFPYKNNPTTDIYFAAPLEDLIAKPLSLNSLRPISRIGPNSFYVNNKAVVIRYVTERELQKLHNLKPRHIYYIIDDDLHFLDPDHSLPQDYRLRLLRFRQNLLPKLLAITDTVVAPNRLILETYPDKNTALLNPSFTFICNDFSHFDSPEKVKIVFSGTRSHLNDLCLIENSISTICRENPHVQLTTFMGTHAPEQLIDRPNIFHRKARSWKEFKQILKSERFHIALAPHVDTRFNRSRSINKIYDHAAFGAAGVYTDLPPINQVVADGQTGALLGPGASDWRPALANMIGDLKKTRKIALAGARLAKKLGTYEVVRQFWIERLFETTVKPGIDK